MKKILRLLILSFLVFLLPALLISCDMLDFSSEEEPCSHRDKNDTGFCDFCYEIYSDGIDVSHTHYFGAWETISLSENDRCEDMEFKRKCLDCDYSETREGKYSDHKFNNTVVDATCTSYGSVKKTCIACGLVEEYDLPLSSHTYGEYVSDASSHWKICSVCGDSTEHLEHTVDKSGYCRFCDCILGVTEGVVYDISVDGTYAEVIKYRGDSRRVIISSEYKGLPVRTVFAEAFYGSDITSVVLPETLYEIGNYAFANCKNLKSIDIGDNVISIGNYAFNSCENLGFVTFGEGLTTIGISAFCKCKSIETVTLSDNVESIGNYAFSECTNL